MTTQCGAAPSRTSTAYQRLKPSSAGLGDRVIGAWRGWAINGLSQFVHSASLRGAAGPFSSLPSAVSETGSQPCIKIAHVVYDHSRSRLRVTRAASLRSHLGQPPRGAGQSCPDAIQHALAFTDTIGIDVEGFGYAFRGNLFRNRLHDHAVLLHGARPIDLPVECEAVIVLRLEADGVCGAQNLQAFQPKVAVAKNVFPIASLLAVVRKHSQRFDDPDLRHNSLK